MIEQVTRYLTTRARWGAMEYAFWLAALATLFLLPGRHLILTEVAWLALFALSLDLILGYAGIISLGHAAFFGLGSSAAALLAKHALINEPVLAWWPNAAAVSFAPAFVLRGSDLARLMVTLGVAYHARDSQPDPRYHRRRDGLQGSPSTHPRYLSFDIFGHVAYAIALPYCSSLSHRAAHRLLPFGLSCSGERELAPQCPDRHLGRRATGGDPIRSPFYAELQAPCWRRRRRSPARCISCDPPTPARAHHRRTGYPYGGLIGR
jgi:branched-chain amino acid transport system permease protein